jgi:hypothetical protein
MNQINEDIQTSLECIRPILLKKGLTRMLFITLENIEHGIDEEFSTKFFSQLQILFDLFDELKQIKKDAKRTEE